jgi:hypothetical protein
VPKLSSSLKIALHWNGLLPINIVTSQFAKVLEEHRLDRIVPIIKELGCRIYELTQSDLVDLLDLSRGQAWVPTSESRLVMASRAVFSSHSLPDGFFSIRRSLVNVAKIFLERMGCTEK